MNEQDRLDELLHDAATTWRVPSDIPREAMWEAIAPQLAAPASPRRRWAAPGWGLLGAAIAASLVLGVALGRQTAGTRLPPTTARTAITASPAAAPYRRTTEELLGQTAVLLVGLPDQQAALLGNDALVNQGLELLQTTRLLLDSPVATEPRMRALLEDLELVLVQVAGLEPRRADELTLIRDAVHQRDLLPRLRSAVVAHSLQLN